MLTTYFKNSSKLAQYRSGIAGAYLDDLVIWFKSQGYCRPTIRQHVRGIHHFTGWVKLEKLMLHDLNRSVLDKFRSHLERRGSFRYSNGDYHHIYKSARIFIKFLEDRGIVEYLDLSIMSHSPALFLEFKE